MSTADKVIIAACVGVLAFYFLKMSNQPVRPPQPNVAGQVAGSDTPVDASPAVQPGDGSGGTVEAPEPPPATATTPIDPAIGSVPAEFANLEPAKPVTMENEDVAFSIDPVDGGMRDIIMRRHLAEIGDESPVGLSVGNVPFLAVQGDQQPLRFSNAIVEESSAEGAKIVTVSRALIGEPLVLRQTWKVAEAEPHKINYSVSVENLGPGRSALPPMRLNLGMMAPLSKAGGFMGSSGIDQRIDLREVDEDPEWFPLTKIAKMNEKKRAKYAALPIDWVAVQNKYFALITDHDEPMTDARMTTIPAVVGADGEEKQPALIGASVALAGEPLGVGETRTWDYEVFAGPKSYKGLKELGAKKEALMHFDLFMFFHLSAMEWVSLFILWMVKMVHGLAGNYGIAIICTTVVIRMAFWPITHQSTLMSRKMQKIQPIIQELNEKYKDDPQKKSMKMMEVYREHNINLAAGCLPVLLQIPVFFALFNVLRSTIELRHQPFFGWVHDLAAPDTLVEVAGFPINPLAAIWGVSMIFQQKCMPQSADPMQRRMMMFMTAGMLVFLYNMPSGLVLYWTVSNLLSILQ